MIVKFIIIYLSFLMKQHQSSFTIYKGKYLCQMSKITIILIFVNFYDMVKCQTANTYNKNFDSSISQPRFQAVSNDGLYFVTSYRNINIDNFRVFKTKTEEQGFSQVADMLLNNTRIIDIKISNQGQKIVYLDTNSYKAKIHWKRTDGSFRLQADQQIYVANGPNSVDISPDGNLMVIVGNDTFAKIYKSNGKFSQYYLFQTIDVLNEVAGEAITSFSNFYTCSISKDLQTLVFSGQTGEIYVYQLTGTTYNFFQKIPSSSGNSSHSITFALKLSSDSTIMIAGTSKNFLSFYRQAKSKNFSAPTIYDNCFLYQNSAYRVTVTENGDTFYASCYQPSPTYIFKRSKNSSSFYTLEQTIETTIDVYSLSVSGQGAYLVAGDKGATSFKIFQYFCGNKSYFSFDGVCQACKNNKCNKCSRFSPNKCFQCEQGLMINNSCQTCSYYGDSCLACNNSSCICDSSNGKTYELKCKNCKEFICRQCFSTCKTCSGSAQSQCLTCNDNYTLQTDNSCAQPTTIINTQGEVSFAAVLPIVIATLIIVISITIIILCLIRRYIHNKHIQDSIYTIQFRLCSICVNEEVQATHSTHCNHYFHIDCISNWILNHKNCPNCRKPVNEIDIREISEIRQIEDSSYAIQFRLCSICLIEEVQATHSTHCNHYFHIDCINNWMLRHKNCPNCRKPVNEIDIREIK